MVSLAIPHSLRRSAWAIRATAARHHFQTLYLSPEVLVVGGVGQEDQPVRAGVGVSVLASFAGAEYARLFDVHSL